MLFLEGEFSVGCLLFMYEDTTPTTTSNCFMTMMLINSKLKAFSSLIYHCHCFFMFVYPFLFD